MKYQHLWRLLEEADMSPEQIATYLGVSGMTLRRWRSRPASENLEPSYEKALSEAVYRLVTDGFLAPDSDSARAVFGGPAPVSFQAALVNLGLSPTLITGESKGDTGLVEGIARIGATDSHKESVDKNVKKITVFEKMGLEWKARIRGLLSVVRSSKLTSLDKLVAYGALFYLLTPFDLIPDHIPVFGLLDDFAILGIAMAYYSKRFPDILNEK